MNKIFSKNTISIIVIIISFVFKGLSQNTGGYQYSSSDLNTITTAVPFLLISPDARASGYGDAGVATIPDINSQHWNPAKYAFLEKKAGISLSYSPWLRALINDINYGYLAAYYKPDDKSAVAISVRYFSLGDITFSNINGTVIGTMHPYEYAADASYSRKLSDKLSLGFAFRYIFSDLTNGMNITGVHSGRSFAGDISMFYSKPICVFNNESKLNFGMNISNVGSKISYTTSTSEGDFIPINLRLGSALSMDLGGRSQLSLMLDFNKLLVPSPPVYQLDSNNYPVIGSDGQPILAAGKDPNVSVLSGMLQSFSDAPGGFKEEIRELMISTGIEYSYHKLFALRSGFFYEDKTKGNRKFFTLGAGIKYNVFGLDFAFLVPLEHNNPLENTFLFTLLFDFDALKNKTE